VRRHSLLTIAALLAACAHHPVQSGDFTFEPRIELPAHPPGGGPRVRIDEAHCNFHTAAGRYAPFAGLLRRDGFRVEALAHRFSAETLAGTDVLVIANALAQEKCETWELPTPPAFAADEVDALAIWVSGGGALLLIADHMPFPGAADALARAFGLAFIDGYARPQTGGPTIRFERASGLLGEHPITAGRTEAERIDAVVSFGGQGFRAVREVDPLLTLPPGTTMYLPTEAGEFDEKTPQFSGEGLLQGTAFRHGEGRVAVFGEAAMFSAQELTLQGRLLQMGMNAPGAEQNAQFVLNLMHWLSGALD
jgi:hypothetical protein